VFAEALALGGLAGYFPLAEQFHTQSDPAFCGLGSLVVALNGLAIDPGRLWKGLTPTQRAQLGSATEPDNDVALSEELSNLRAQLAALWTHAQSNAPEASG
jgi:Phytochelatin synthase